MSTAGAIGSVLLQISDPHFGTEQAPVAEALVTLVARERPRVLVLSGDITQRARPAQFAAAARFVEQLGVPDVLVLPGNHDISLFNPFARLLCPRARYQREFGPQIEPELDSAALLVICVDTTRRYRHVDGEISAHQVERVARRLEHASAAQIRIVVTHQPLDVPRAEDEHDLVHGREAAVRAWTQAGADIVMGGHIHLPYVLPLSRRYPGMTREAWCVQAGTALSSRVRPGAPNSVNLLRYGDAQASTGPRCVVERWDHSAASSAFERINTTDLLFARP